jgi:Cys-tRNA(Pro)/Cys-tRNA(Cys) deacylase
MEKADKTNALRLAEAAGVAYELRAYAVDESDLSAEHAAQAAGLDPETVFKTIVLRGGRGGCFVCVVPGPYEVDLKKAAKAAGEKSAAPIALKELEPLTGYVRGGCSPVGLKKPLPIYLDETALVFDRISVSAGRRGLQMLVAPAELLRLTGAAIADLI